MNFQVGDAVSPSTMVADEEAASRGWYRGGGARGAGGVKVDGGVDAEFERATTTTAAVVN